MESVSSLSLGAQCRLDLLFVCVYDGFRYKTRFIPFTPPPPPHPIPNDISPLPFRPLHLLRVLWKATQTDSYNSTERWSTFNLTSTWTTESAGATAPPSPASTVILPRGRYVTRTQPPTPYLLSSRSNSIQCDRKRPCSRCIQLGLVRVHFIHSLFLTLIRHSHKTGLCVYEVDDPAIRDDPNVDEVTKLRNRIAELESLVRELRGIGLSLPSLPLPH